MNKFFDGGTHFFQGFHQFVQSHNIDSKWKCWCFEANPTTFEESKAAKPEGFNINHQLAALSDKDGLVEVNCVRENNGHFTSQGSNILAEKPSSDGPYGMRFVYEKDRKLVTSVRFSSLLKDTVKRSDFVLVKLDIEGAEFAVMDDLIATNAIMLIDELYVEFHERFFPDINHYATKKEEYKAICSELGVKLTEWG